MVGNCGDCIHFESCSAWNKKFIDLRIKRQSVCEHFKNKADFVEVVRCRNCKYAYFRYNTKDTQQEIYACKKRPAGRAHKKVSGDFFCAHGEKRNKEE